MNKPKGEQQGLYKEQQQHNAMSAWQFSSELEIAKTVSVQASTIFRIEVFREYEYICSLCEYPMNAFRLDGELFVFARFEESCLCWGVFGIDFPSDLLVRA